MERLPLFPIIKLKGWGPYTYLVLMLLKVIETYNYTSYDQGMS